jgi:oligopeptidase A
MKNPLLENFALPPYGKFKTAQLGPALKKVLADNLQELDKLLKQKPLHTWKTLMQPLEEMSNRLHNVWSIIENLNGVLNSKEIRELHDSCLPELISYSLKFSHNLQLYKVINSLQKASEFKNYTAAQKKIIENDLRDFKLAGVDLPTKAKDKFAEIQQKLGELQNKFQNNILDATQAWSLVITDKNKLSGLPEHALQAAKELAKNRNSKGYIFTLDYPSYLAVMTHADSAEIRETCYTAFATRASDQGPNANKFDNSKIITEILAYRREMAKILRFKNYAEYSLASKMAKKPDTVLKFLNKLIANGKTKAKADYDEIAKFAQKKFGIKNLQPWDILYYSEKLKQSEYGIAENELKAYFPLPKVLAGVFQLINKLYGIIIEKSNVKAWHTDVQVYALYSQNGTLLSYLYFDLYARSNKQSGAWMSDVKSRARFDSKLQLPIANVVCNFTQPLKNIPSLLTHNDVLTLLHELGHALNHVLTKVDYLGVSGINGIAWDIVEFPSQFMEHWGWEKRVLDVISGHYQTGKKLPVQLFNKMIKAKNFQSGMQLVRQLEFALFDMRLHLEFDPQKKQQVQKILDDVRKKTAVIKYPKFHRFQNSFSHIFAGSYAAGYYSYKWAEVFACDAFAAFQEHGLFNKKIGKSFLDNVLAVGGSIDLANGFKKFRGRAPKIDFLLKYDGIK